ncbi:hypothetical protein PCASD_22117, partial [Puccinia coronata f. sp. avenae]
CSRGPHPFTNFARTSHHRTPLTNKSGAIVRAFPRQTSARTAIVVQPVTSEGQPETMRTDDESTRPEYPFWDCESSSMQVSAPEQSFKALQLLLSLIRMASELYEHGSRRFIHLNVWSRQVG